MILISDNNSKRKINDKGVALFRGTIVILAFHSIVTELILWILKILHMISDENKIHLLLAIMIAFMVIVILYPVILFREKLRMRLKK